MSVMQICLLLNSLFRFVQFTLKYPILILKLKVEKLIANFFCNVCHANTYFSNFQRTRVVEVSDGFRLGFPAKVEDMSLAIFIENRLFNAAESQAFRHPSEKI